VGNIFTLGGVGTGSGGGGGGGTNVDMVTTFESGTNGNPLTVGDLNAATTKTAAAAGTWTIPVLAPTIDNTGTFVAAPRQFRVSGAGVPDGGTRILRMNTAADQIQANYALTTQAPAASVGFAWYCNPEGTFNFYNWGDITGTSGGDYNAFHHFDDSPNSTISSEDGLSNLGTLITIPAPGWYWITMLYDNPNNVVRLRCYNPSTWAQIGVESTTSPTLSFDVGSFNVGRTDNHDAFGSNSFYVDYWAMCLSTGVGATWPLLPA